MLISRKEFRRQLAQNQLRLALVGMSNSGKSTCTRLLSQQFAFGTFEVDEAINSELGINDMAQAAEWMGYPFDEKYSRNKQRYLDLEARFSRVDIPKNRNFVLDTTGSIIYANPDIRHWIQENFLVVGLKVSESLSKILVNDYFTHPKTVIWGDEFNIQPNEDGLDALKRCYPKLLEQRSILYSELADLEISADVARDPDLEGDVLIGTIESLLPE